MKNPLRHLSAIPGVQLVGLEGAGHVPQMDTPEAVHAAVLGFLAGKK